MVLFCVWLCYWIRNGAIILLNNKSKECCLVEGFSRSCNEFAGASSSLDSLLSGLGEKFSSNDHWDGWKSDSFSEDLEVTLYKLIEISFNSAILNWLIKKKNLRVEKQRLDKKTRLTDLVTSMTGAMSLLLAALFLVASVTRDQSLSVLIVGQKYLLFCLWKTLIPIFP